MRTRLAAGLLLLLLTLASCSSGSSSDATDGSQPDTVEYKLAVVDEGGYVRPDDPIVQEFADALNVAEERCYQNSRTRIGDYTVSIQRQLAERGVTESLLTILQAIADPSSFAELQQRVDKEVLGGGIPESSQEGDCAAYVTAYLLIRT